MHRNSYFRVHQTINMVNFRCIPQAVLEKILQFLPLRDQINSGFVCAYWNEVVGYNLKHVTIDPSMPFDGRWLEVNLRSQLNHRIECLNWPDLKEKVWYRNEDDPADQEMKKLIPMLCSLTNKIETLNIDNYYLDTETLTGLLSSQTGIKTLQIKIRNLPAWVPRVKNVYFERIVEVIIRHQETIEVIAIEIATGVPDLEMCQDSITKIQDIITCKGRWSFPMLKSLTLTKETCRAIRQLLSNDLFDSLIATSQLEELYISDAIHLIKNGNLGLLKKCSLPYYHDENEVEELIKHCPHITHLGLDAWRHYGYQWEYLRSVLKIISTYGPQLKCFGCIVNSKEIANAILEKCKNLESLFLDFDIINDMNYEGPIDEFVVIESSILLFGYLEKLTKLELEFGCFEVEAKTVCELIKRCGMNLQSLVLEFEGYESHKILNAIGANCKNLKNLRLDIFDSSKDIEEAGIRESVKAILEGCQMLRTLDLNVRMLDGATDNSFNTSHIIDDQIGSKLPHLRHVKLHHVYDYSTPNLVKLIEALPYCNILDY